MIKAPSDNSNRVASAFQSRSSTAVSRKNPAPKVFHCRKRDSAPQPSMQQFAHYVRLRMLDLSVASSHLSPRNSWRGWSSAIIYWVRILISSRLMPLGCGPLPGATWIVVNLEDLKVPLILFEI